MASVAPPSAVNPAGVVAPSGNTSLQTETSKSAGQVMVGNGLIVSITGVLLPTHPEIVSSISA